MDTRPDTIKVQLIRSYMEDSGIVHKEYIDAAGLPYSTQSTETETEIAGNNNWSRTWNDIPEKVNPTANDNQPGKSYRYIYQVEEVSNLGGYSNTITDLIITNVMKVTSLKVVKVWNDDHDQYHVRPDDVTVALQRKVTGEQEWTTLDQTMVIPNEKTEGMSFEGLPVYNKQNKQYEYRAVEIKAGNTWVDGSCVGKYAVSYSYTKDITTITNSLMVPSIAIENETVNASKNYSNESAPTNAGGRIMIITEDNRMPDIYEEYVEAEEMLGVAWIPDDDWELGEEFTLTYQERVGETTQNILVRDYMDSDRKIRPITDPVYDAIRVRFPDATIEQNEDGVIRLVLTDDYMKMPYKTNIQIAFVPTIAVENTTKDHVGGVVSVMNGTESNVSNGYPEQDGHRRYIGRQVYGKANEGYMVDLDHITLHPTQGDTTPMVVTIEPDRTFQTTVKTMLAGELTQVLLFGHVNIVEDVAGNPVKADILFDSEKVPVNVGVCFTPVVTEQNMSAASPTVQVSEDQVNATVVNSEDRNQDQEQPYPKTSDPLPDVKNYYILIVCSGVGYCYLARRKRKHKN